MEVQKLMALFLLCLATTASVGWCRMVDTSPQEMTHDDQAKQRSDALADWTASKISEGVEASSNSGAIKSLRVRRLPQVPCIHEPLYEVKSHTASDAMQNAEETARRTMESTSDMAEEAKNEASDAYNKASEASGPAMENMGNMADKAKNEASDAYNKASEASGPAMETVGDMASGMAEKIKEGAQSAYEYAFGKVHVSMGEDVHNAYTHASDKASGAKELMKEKASDAYDSVSHKMGETVRIAAEQAQVSGGNSISFEEAREKAYDAYLYAGDRFEGAKEAAAKQCR